MGSLIITFDEAKECVYKVSIQVKRNSKSQKRTRPEAETPKPRLSVFQILTPTASDVQITPLAVKPIEKAAPLKLWVSKYAENPLCVHLKENQDTKKVTPTHLRVTKEVSGQENCELLKTLLTPTQLMARSRPVRAKI